MKKQNILFLGFVLIVSQLSFAAQTENTIVNSIDSKESEDVERSFGVGGGFYSMNNEFSSGESETLQGFRLTGSKEFRITSRLSTTSKVSIGQVANENSQDSVQTETSFTHIGTSQQFSYLTHLFGARFIPSIGIGFDIGRYEQSTSDFSAQEREVLGIKAIETESQFFKLQAILGVELVVTKNFSPFLSYAVGAISFSEPETTIKSSGSKDDVDVESKLDNIQTQALSLGINYYF